MLDLFVDFDIYTGLSLLLVLAFVLLYRAANGFRDTVNAVATVIYTRTMQPQLAAVIVVFFNLFGVLLGGPSVAYAIAHILPTDLLLNTGSIHDLAMVLSTLLVAIIWNLGTQFFDLPASSSHTLIGAIIGIGLTSTLLAGSSVMGALNLREVTKIFSSLIVSLIVGLVTAGGLIFLLRRYWSGTKRRDRIHRIPGDCKKKKGKRKPSFWTRTVLIVPAAGVVFSYGANDGQKGIGLMALVLVGIAPVGLVVNMSASGYEVTRTCDAVTNFEHYLQQYPELSQRLIVMGPPLPAVSTDGTQVTEFHRHPVNTFDVIAYIKTMLSGNMESYGPLSVSQCSQLHRIMLCISDTSAKLAKLPGVSKEDQNLLKKLRGDMLSIIEYAPVQIIMVVALTLGIGAMVDQRRIAMTIDEKVDKRGMTYAQGMAVQVTAAVSIDFTSYTGVSISTTYVLSSTVAGTMVADGGGLQHKMVTSILMAWVFALPAAIFLSDGLCWIALQLI